MQTERILKLLAYLERECDGEDRYEFWTADGEPDIRQARQFAEGIRDQLGGFLNDFIAVEQRVNVVRLSTTEELETCEVI